MNGPAFGLEGHVFGLGLEGQVLDLDLCLGLDGQVFGLGLDLEGRVLGLGLCVLDSNTDLNKRNASWVTC